MSQTTQPSTSFERGPDSHPPHSEVTLAPGSMDALRGRIRGEVLLPGDSGYEEARRLWNGVIDRRPAAIARCEGAADVVAAVQFAREEGVPITVRGGGHNVSGSAVRDGALVIDLSRMRSVRVDPERGTVRAEGGATLGDIDRETQLFGLAVPMGVVSRTGIGGLSLHGGLGFQSRKHGLASDNLVAADVVAGDGTLLRVDETRHPDLLWGLRGGGGNFGVVTSFEFRVHPLGPDIALAIVAYPVARAREVLRAFRDFMTTAPDEIMGIALLWNSSASEELPAAARNVPVAVLAAAYAGDPAVGEAALRPLREVDEPLFDLSGTLPFVEAQRLFDPDYPDGRRYYWKSTYLRGADEELIDLLIAAAADRPSEISSIDLWALGGAIARVSPEQTAFARRDAPFLLGIEANWDDPDADGANIEWARTLFDQAQPFSTGGTYLNFPGFVEEGDELLRQTYGVNYDRLRQIKRRYDPENLFRGGLNIRPAE